MGSDPNVEIANLYPIGCWLSLVPFTVQVRTEAKQVKLHCIYVNVTVWDPLLQKSSVTTHI